MSDRRRAGAMLWSLALAAGLALPASAAGQAAPARTTQQLADDRANALRDRFTKAWAHRDRLNASLDSSIRAQAAAPPLDTIVAGAIVVRLRGEPVPTAFRARIVRGAELAWATASKTLGASADQFAGHPINLTRQPRNVWDREPRSVLAFPGKNNRWRPIGMSATPERVADALLDLYGSFAGAAMPNAVRRWTTSDWVPLTPNDREAWQQAAVALATSRSSYARRCYEGIVADCTVALDLVADSTPDRLRAWYRTEDIPTMVSEYRGRDSAEQNLFRRCTTGRNVAVCDSAALKRTIVWPVPVSTKLSLLGFALERGGADAYARLISSSGSAGDVLATTAGVPTDQLLTAWRAKLIQATPERTLPGPLEGATLIAWTALFATLATRRRP